MRKVLRWIFSGMAGFIGLLLVSKLFDMGILPEDVPGVFNLFYTNLELIIFVIIAGIAYCSVANPMAKKLSHKFEIMLAENTLQEILIYIVAVAIGLGVANLMGSAFGQNKKYISFNVLLYIGFGYFGFYIAQAKIDEIKKWFSKKPSPNQNGPNPKILDTSVIIDGRIMDIIGSGFMEGLIVIPVFVLEELRHIADSSDALKRNRGRRGLDVLNKMQEELDVDVKIVEKDYKNIEEVDSKLVKLAEEFGGSLVTNDYNLNKVASFQKMEVLNINELANAVKPVVLPGEKMQVLIVKEGKEDQQGIAYLNDGTMIVVEGGRQHVGSMVDVIVTSVLQTAAGRMIFTKINK